MTYLSGHVCPKDEHLIGHPRFGLMTQPRSYGIATIAKWHQFAYDCGGYGGKFTPDEWLPGLDRVAMYPDRCIFATSPDRFDPDDLAGNFAATQEMWEQWHPEIIQRGLVAAWVAQNGATPDDIPNDAGAVFIGGDTTRKLSERAWAVVAAAKARGRWVHIGRINGLPRFRAGSISMADSSDGNVLAFGCEANRHRVMQWIDATEQPHLALFGGREGDES